MDEYISREAALKATCEYCCEHDSCNSPCVEYLQVAELPAADVRPVVRGKWTRHDYSPIGHDYQCSECGWNNDMASHFCPMCGADMRDPKSKGLECECDTCRIPETGTCRFGEEG